MNNYSGGFAEFVPNPTPLTYSFLKSWFTSQTSLGAAMKILELPVSKTSKPILVMRGKELVVDLTAEEEALYKSTFFKYKNQKNITDVPALTISIKNLLNPAAALGTLNILLKQSLWIAKPKDYVRFANSLSESIPTEFADVSIEKIDIVMRDKVWPKVLAIGLLCEFYNQYLLREMGKDAASVNKYIGSNIAEKDWFFLSLSDQQKVKNGNLSFSEYIKHYGLRSDKDYEIAAPRWYEIPDLIKKRIERARVRNSKKEEVIIPEKLKKLANILIELELARTDAKRRALSSVDRLRKAIIKIVDNEDIGNYEKEDLLQGKIIKKEHKGSEEETDVTSLSHHTGVGVSAGRATGVVKNIKDNMQNISKDTIGIFPNASPEFAVQFPKCEGMIFLAGGQTSHGSIVAREFGIPALIDGKAAGIANGTKIEINGATGEWKCID